jgi:hypothetical protein
MSTEHELAGRAQSDSTQQSKDDSDATETAQHALSGIALLQEGASQPKLPGQERNTGALTMDNPYRQESPAALFKNPDDVLSTLRADFSDISAGKDYITPSDLERTIARPRDAKEGAAAAIAAANLHELAGIANDNSTAWIATAGNFFSQPAQNISKGDLDFATDMENGNIKGRIGSAVLGDMGDATVEGFLGGGAASMVALGLSGPEVAGILGVGFTVGAGVVFTGIAAYSIYESGRAVYDTFQENKRLTALSAEDQNDYAKWLK